VDAVLEARRHFGARPHVAGVAGVDRGVSEGWRDASEAGSGAVVALGPVSEDRVMRLPRRDRARLSVALEGFGLPLIEAMAADPVWPSHEASMPEVLGGAGLLLDPRDVSAWRDAIIRVVNDEALRGDSARARARPPRDVY